MISIRIALPLLFVAFGVVVPISAAFTLDIAPEAGFQTGVPGSGTTSITRNYAYSAVSVEPSWEKGISEKAAMIYGFPVSATYYIAGPREFGIEPNFAVEKRKGTAISHLEIDAAYYYEPAELDPTAPEQYLKYSFNLEQKFSGAFSPAVKYTLSFVHDPSNERLDKVNHLNFSIRHQVSDAVTLSAGTGGALNRSNIKYAGYVQWSLSAGTVIAVSEKNTLMLQTNASCSYHEKKSISGLIQTNNSKSNPKYDTLFHLSEYTIPLVTLYCGFDREMTTRLSAHFYYMGSFYGNGESDQLSVSHQIGVLFDWYRE